MKIKILIVTISLLITTPCIAATYYMPDDFANLQAAFAGMSGGDTLIIRDGTYTGAANAMSHTQKPPNGSAGNFTTIRAENEGKAIFEGVNWAVSAASYYKFIGIVWKRSLDTGGIEISSATRPHHIWLYRCSAYSEESIAMAAREDAISIGASDNILVEECSVWGNFRYGFYVGNNASNVVLRRCVCRIDAYNTETDISAYMMYDCKNVEVQNCIAIDIDNNASYYQENGSTGETPNAFYFRSTVAGTVDNVNVIGCIALNVSTAQFILGSGATSINFSNCVFWDGYEGIRSRYGGATFDHCVSGIISGTTTDAVGYYTENSSEPITNSIAYRVTTTGIQSGGAYSLCDYNCLYNNGTDYSNATPGVHSFCAHNSNAIDPLDGGPGNGIAALKYLCRIENGSNLDGVASDGGDIGATILKKIGVTGTFWGETGSDTVTSEDLWPFPNEGTIREKMRAYSYDSGNLTGNRGFCADGTTLTKYIWEYLGNTIPEEIYNDTTSPAAVNDLTGGSITTTTVTLTWTAPGDDGTSGEATSYDIRYSTSNITDGNWALATQVNDEPEPSTAGTIEVFTISGLSSGTTYYFALKAQDEAGNVSGISNIASTSDSIVSSDGGGGGGGCFIATAAFGTPMEKQVVILKEVRDRYLVNKKYGKKFVSFYYKFSPPIAKYIEKRKWARAIFRILLKPVVWLASHMVE